MKKVRVFPFLFLTAALFAFLSSCTTNQNSNRPPVHILMPVYNVNRFVSTAIQSIAEQTYGNIKLLIYNDGCTDNTMGIIQDYLDKNPAFRDKVIIKSSDMNMGVAAARIQLLKWSKALNPQAYILWLDADDQYTTPDFVQDVIQKMQETKADVCLFNFSIVFEDEKQKNNATGLLEDKKKVAEIINTILAFPTQSISPLQLPNLLEFTSLGWTKCYAPTAKLEAPDNCPFEDFIFMTALLEANTITALPAEKEPIEYLRRSTSVCGQRTRKNFTHDVPVQLLKFFNVVVKSEDRTPERLQKLKMAQGFVSRKLAQYRRVLNNIVQDHSFPGIGQKTIQIYNKRADILEGYVNQKIERLAQLSLRKAS